MYYKGKKFYFPQCYTISVGYLSLSSLSLCYLFLIFFFFNPFLFACLLPYIGISFVLIPTIVLSIAKFSRIFSSFLLVSSLPLFRNFWLLGGFVLFKLSHMHLMWQRLGGSPLINVEVKIFILLTYFEDSPRFPSPYLDVFKISKGEGSN